ncbi:DUF2798 domain-containing protein [Duganella sp. P38]|uniref:DUF2798 domain-containing protein n=1 Tax=Duganella sp. P38 TaxID=3423949 RepID=UPI003D7AEAAF
MNPALRMRTMFALLMSLLMSSLMSGWVTWLNLGLGPNFLPHWQTAFMAAGRRHSR